MYSKAFSSTYLTSLTASMLEFNGKLYHQIRGTAIGTKCAPLYSILLLAELEEKHLSSYGCKPSVWWRYIDDVFLFGRMVKKSLKIY